MNAEEKRLFEKMTTSSNSMDIKMDKLVLLMTKMLEHFEGK